MRTEVRFCPEEIANLGDIDEFIGAVKTMGARMDYSLKDAKLTREQGIDYYLAMSAVLIATMHERINYLEQFLPVKLKQMPAGDLLQ